MSLSIKTVTTTRIKDCPKTFKIVSAVRNTNKTKMVKMGYFHVNTNKKNQWFLIESWNGGKKNTRGQLKAFEYKLNINNIKTVKSEIVLALNLPRWDLRQQSVCGQFIEKWSQGRKEMGRVRERMEPSDKWHSLHGAVYSGHLGDGSRNYLQSCVECTPEM